MIKIICKKCKCNLYDIEGIGLLHPRNGCTEDDYLNIEVEDEFARTKYEETYRVTEAQLKKQRDSMIKEAL